MQQMDVPGGARHPRSLAARSAAGLVLPGLLLLGTAGCSPLDSLNPVTPQGRSIASFFNLVMIPSALVFLLVVGLLTYVLIRFRGRPGDPDPPQVHGNQRLELFWTIAPHVLLAGLFVGMISTMQTVNGESPAALRVKVIGHQWWWEYQYPDLGIVTANELHLPVGTAAVLDIEAADVVHSFWVPQIGWKKDAIPGKTNTMWVRVDEAGIFDGACAEFCGAQHAWMRVRLVAEPPTQFDAWVANQRQPAASPQTERARLGQQLFTSGTCVSCHTIRGTAEQSRVGPDLTHFGSRTILGAGVADTSPESLHRWIKEVQKVKPGVLMPNYTSMSDADIAALAEYLLGLQ